MKDGVRDTDATTVIKEFASQLSYSTIRPSRKKESDDLALKYLPQVSDPPRVTRNRTAHHPGHGTISGLSKDVDSSAGAESR